MVQQQLATEKETFEQEAAKLRQSLAVQTQGMAELEQRVAATVADKQASAAGPQAAMEELVRHCSVFCCVLFFVAEVYAVMCCLCYAVLAKEYSGSQYVSLCSQGSSRVFVAQSVCFVHAVTTHQSSVVFCPRWL